MVNCRWRTKKGVCSNTPRYHSSLHLVNVSIRKKDVHNKHILVWSQSLFFVFPMHQTSITQWYPIQQDLRITPYLPYVFYLYTTTPSSPSQSPQWAARWYTQHEWNNKNHHPSSPSPSSSHPSPHHPPLTVQWRIHGRKGPPIPIRVCADPSLLPSSLDSQQTSLFPQQQLPNTAHTPSTSVPFLKSHLQKCVRKGNAPLAVATAKLLMQRDMVQLVRRLAIIMVEDTDVHPSFNVLTWWTVYLSHLVAVRKQNGSDERLTVHDVPMDLCEWLLGVVHVLCELPVFRQIPYDVKSVSALPSLWMLMRGVMEGQQQPQTVSPSVSDTSDTTTPPPHPTVVHTIYSLLFRLTYGGLKGDLRLLHGVVDAYAHPPLVHTPPSTWTIPIRPIIYDTVVRLLPESWDLDAIDFHVVPGLIRRLEDRLEEQRWRESQNGQDGQDGQDGQNRIPGIDVRRMIWENASSVNVRPVVQSSRSVSPTETRLWTVNDPTTCPLPYANALWKEHLSVVRRWQRYWLGVV